MLLGLSQAGQIGFVRDASDVYMIRSAIESVHSFLVGALTKSRSHSSKFHELFHFEDELMRKGVDRLTWRFNQVGMFKDA